MRWSIDFPIPHSHFPITYQSKILSMGSCFAQTIGQKMNDAKFEILINPFGTIFHPMALARLLEVSIFSDPFDENLILERDGMFFHYEAHSDLVGKTKAELLEKLNQRRDLVLDFLKTGTHLILTLGTAWGYELLDQGLVANCHKQPQSMFTKRLWKKEDMKLSLDVLFHNLHQINPNLKIILTVSPVRHLKDGIPENQLSKSLLRVLCADLEESHANITYFPAYEVMMDELRDYRFYKSDLIHPSEEAENYIWENWQQALFSLDTQTKVAEITKIRMELAHRPLNPDSASHRKFLQNLLSKLERLNAEFDFSKEIKSISDQLNPATTN
ncbi:GSCFA family protein [Algoriphagus lacus]|uniref:GSCFA family protein n=1 Tax=Algoriphagus lacus TaxID=2056311 RepID=A0A418PRE7_9BACT|nr:GSCFA domain-containing protein [Algoriphagus lacus]RIW15161.1 GSCFA family protein [Algoriphagus lacus]